MPRTRSLPEKRYAPGVYGPFTVDNLTNANTAAIEFTMTVGADWPADQSAPAVRVTMLWDTGGGGAWTYNGGPRNQDGTPRTLIRETVPVIPEADNEGILRKRAIAGGNLTVEVFQPLTTALTLAGV